MVETYLITEFLLPKLAACLSMIGSSLILAELYQDYRIKNNQCSSKNHHNNKRHQRRRRLSAVPRCLISMSIGDLLFSMAWFLASWVTTQSEDIRLEYDSTTSGACKFQGFLMQWGYLSSLCFNAMLAVIATTHPTQNYLMYMSASSKAKRHKHEK